MKFIKNEKNLKNIQKLLKALIITLLFEIFIFNFPAFRTLLVGNKNMRLEYDIQDNNIIISDINKRITSIFIKYGNKLTDKVTYRVHYISEEDSDGYDLNEKIILENDSHYINFDTHSKCKQIEINLQTSSEILINDIILNHVNFYINIWRMLLTFFICIFFIDLKTGEIYKKEYHKESKSFWIILCVICVWIVTYTILQKDSESLFVSKDEVIKDDAILMQTEAFMHGKVYLLEEPSEKLKNMEDPYNYSEKINKEVPFLYDVTYYNGHYYSYFGVAPIITLILPFRLITGKYVHTYIFNLVYVIGNVLLIYGVYKKFFDRYIKKDSLFHFYLGYFTILMASNVLTSLRGLKYDIVVSSGIFFILLSIRLAMSLENEKYQKLKLIFLGISMALIVLSKPTFIVYYPLIVYLALKNLQNLETREKLKKSLYTIIPLGIFAILQMIYNYLRFDSIFEFGAKYQLTSFNMKYCMGISFGKIYEGFLKFLFRFPNIKLLEFPFVFINTYGNIMSLNEVCYENRMYGLMAIPVFWVFLFKKFATEDKELKKITNLNLIITAIAIILNTCTGGICENYALDFKCILAINSVILLLSLNKQKKNSKEIERLTLLLCLVTIFIMLPISLTTEGHWLENNLSSTTIFLKNIFEFWS